MHVNACQKIDIVSQKFMSITKLTHHVLLIETSKIQTDYFKIILLLVLFRNLTNKSTNNLRSLISYNKHITIIRYNKRIKIKRKFIQLRERRSLGLTWPSSEWWASATSSTIAIRSLHSLFPLTASVFQGFLFPK